MVLIISNSDDYSTNSVIDWICLKKKFKIIRDVAHVPMNLKLDNNEEIFRCNDFGTKNIESYWYRRGLISNPSEFLEEFSNKNFDEKYIEDILKSVRLEIDRMNQYFHMHFANSDKITLGSFLRNTVNKIDTLKLAKKSGLNIPLTVVTSNKKDVEEAFGKEEFIVKPIAEASIYFDYQSKIKAFTYTSILTLEDIQEEFHVSLFQKKIDKKYEIRTFILDKKYYSMAIFSQENHKTKVDFRNYDAEYPNRTVPYKLPLKIEEKINVFMESMNLNSGSIDFLVTNENEIIFLEINPLGQFGMVSEPCNYNLEKKIAEYLTNY